MSPHPVIPKISRRGRQIWGGMIYFISFFYFLVFLPFVGKKESESLFRSRLRKAIGTAFAALKVKVVLHGTEHLRTDGNALIIANHSSWFDQLALLQGINRPITFLANKKYFSFLFLSRVLQKLEAVPVVPGIDASSIQSSRNLLARDKWLVIYPEGTRSPERLPFRRGAALLAQKTKIPIQPIEIVGAETILPRKKSLMQVNPGTIDVYIHPLLHPEGMTAKEMTTELESQLTPRSSRPNRASTLGTETHWSEITNPEARL